MNYILGVGRTKFGVLKENIAEMAYEAINKALRDADLSINDIRLIYVSNFCAGPLQNQLHLNSLVASLFPKNEIPIIRIETACASGGSAFFQGVISLSKFDNILIVGVEKMTDIDNTTVSKNISSAGDKFLDQNEGLIFPAQYALIAQQHMLEFGTTEENLHMVACKNHRNGNLNELAHFYSKKVDLEMIKKSPLICTPFRLFDCSPISDGAAAVIISSHNKSKRDINIRASCLSTDSISISQRKKFTSFKAAKKAAFDAYLIAQIKPHDIDLAEVHDCFTIGELIAMEDLGFCEEGESRHLVIEGKTEIDGDIPINTDGGLKADGHPIGATGIAQIYEIVTQLRGEAGQRQVKKADIGLTHNIGGSGGTAVVNILSKF